MAVEGKSVVGARRPIGMFGEEGGGRRDGGSAKKNNLFGFTPWEREIGGAVANLGPGGCPGIYMRRGEGGREHCRDTHPAPYIAT